MSKINDGGRAFPLGMTNEMESVGVSNEGMSLRAWLAGQALTGLLSGRASQEHGVQFFAIDRAAVAMEAVGYADALLAELGKE